ncbi:MATE family efflux transporter [Pullulanibacillus sp. KACC 23026]|uniref:MATE family efflux transporter n=1 Tax=Pullulanibacillus sp. KACC 23026 TaxID=3028315 RepID=UPI0023B0D760|nr:MATE family efflux transporter [Pullulanibacillus sp. KACC 23026]WEG12330.1 MATE family efflux transporter [Pullulanibacillus sp. KACC 23026]
MNTKDKSLFRLTWPIFIEILLQMLMGSADTLMLSHYSDSSVAAVGMANQILQIVFVLFNFTTLGTIIMVSRLLGAKDKGEALQVGYTSIVMNASVGLILGLVLWLSGHGLLHLMNTPFELMAQAMTYLNVVGGFIFLAAISMTIGAILRSFGFTKDAMMVTIGINILNIIGNLLFVFGPGMFPRLGVYGSALSTTVSRAIGVIILLSLLIIRTGVVPKLSMFVKHRLDHLKELMKIGVPSAGEQLSYDLSQLVITYFVTLLGTEALTTKIYLQNIMMFIFLFSVSVGEGSQILISHYVGAGRYKEAFLRGMTSIKVGFIGSFTIAIFFYFFGQGILGLFTHNPDILHEGKWLLLLTVILEPGRAFNLILISALRCVGDVRYPVYLGMIVMWLIGLPVAWLCGIALDLGLMGIWISFITDEWLRGLLIYRRWTNKRWERYIGVKEKVETEGIS